MRKATSIFCDVRFIALGGSPREPGQTRPRANEDFAACDLEAKAFSMDRLIHVMSLRPLGQNVTAGCA